LSSHEWPGTLDCRRAWRRSVGIPHIPRQRPGGRSAPDTKGASSRGREVELSCQQSLVLPSQSPKEPVSASVFVRCGVTSSKAQDAFDPPPVKLGSDRDPRYSGSNGLEDHAASTWIQVSEHRSHSSGRAASVQDAVAVDGGRPPVAQFSLDDRLAGYGAMAPGQRSARALVRRRRRRAGSPRSRRSPRRARRPRPRPSTSALPHRRRGSSRRRLRGRRPRRSRATLR